MNQNDFKKLLKEVFEPVNKQLGKITNRLTGVEKQLNDPDSGLAAINSRLDANIAAIIELEETVNGYGDMYKINEDHIRRLDKRLDTVENELNIQPPEELTIPA